MENVYFGVTANSGDGSGVVDVLQIVTKELEDEEERNLAMGEEKDVLGEKLKEMEIKASILLERLKGIQDTDEYKVVMAKISLLKERAYGIIHKIPVLRAKLADLHVDDSFTTEANKEIAFVAAGFAEILARLEAITSFVDNKEILAGVYQAIDRQYKKNTEMGERLISEFKTAEKAFDNFELSFEEDNRLFWVHIGLIFCLLFIILLCCKIINIEKVSVITH
jgi:hypothetical protein